MIEYRSFTNSDPPRLHKLWHRSELGRGAALGFTCDALDMLIFSQPYFDRCGLLVACAGDEVVGFAHAGFGTCSAGDRLSCDTGVVAALMVRPDYRRQGIGRELLSRAEAYLRGRGAGTIYVGEAERRNPFYLGLYGGSSPVGVLQSDVHAAPFLAATGYLPSTQHVVLQRDISQRDDPFDPRLVAIRRKAQLQISDHPPGADWWWMTRQGRFDTIHFGLGPAADGPVWSSADCWGMDLHTATWRQRTVGFNGVFTAPLDRRKGYAKALLLEMIRRLRDELVTQIEVAVPAENAAALALFKWLRFEPVDRGIVYQKQPAAVG